MAVSSTFVGCPKLETLLNHHNLSSSSSSTSQTPLGLSGVRAFLRNNRNRRGLIQRARCELSASDSASNAASISALEQLKNSAADSMISIHFSVFWVCLDAPFPILVFQNSCLVFLVGQLKFESFVGQFHFSSYVYVLI